MQGDSKTSLTNEVYTIIMFFHPHVLPVLPIDYILHVLLGTIGEYCWHVCLNICPELDIGIAMPVVLYLQV